MSAAAESPFVSLRSLRERVLGRSLRERVSGHSPGERVFGTAASPAARGGESKPYDLAKRVLDVSLAGSALVASLPVQAGLAVAVAKNLGRPVLFTQERPGKDGVVFKLRKFRTMRNPDATHQTDAERLTDFGKFLRSTSLDELPSLWNIVKGDMSLVGPRPLLVSYLPLYTERQGRRHDVRPGLTGLAQVSGRNATTWAKRLAYDVFYVENRSLKLDADIIWRTVSSVFKREGISQEGEATMSFFTGAPDEEISTMASDSATSSKRPVLVIQHYALPRDQGGGTRAIDLFGRLQKWTPTIVASNFGHANARRYTTTDPHFVLVPVPSYTSNGIARVLGMPAFTAEAIAVGLTKKADVVFGSIPHLLNPVAALVLARLKGVPFVLEVRDLWPESIVAGGKIEENSTLHRTLVLLEKTLYQQAAKIVVVTGGWEEHFASLGIPADKLVMIPNGTEVSDFNVSESRDQLRAEYGINGTTAIFAGSHGPKDGIFLILDAAEQTPDVNFILIGDGIDKPKAIEAAKQRGLTNVEFREPIPKSELPRLLRACDIGLHVVTPLSVFNKGMSPNKLFDYLASGIAVVSNAPVPLRNVVRDDEVGPIVEPDQISVGIRRALAADDATRARWREHAQMLMNTTYSRSAASTKLEKVLDDAVAANRGVVKTALRTASDIAAPVLGVVGGAAWSVGKSLYTRLRPAGDAG